MTPLSYASLTTVLQHLPADKRISISHRCPTIRRFEKIVPMKIRYLHIEGAKLIVDDTWFDMDIRDFYDILPHPVSGMSTWTEPERQTLRVHSIRESAWNETLQMGNRSRKDALEYLLLKIFGGRSRNVINCNTVSIGYPSGEIDALTPPIYPIPNLPGLLRFHTKHLILTDTVNSDDLNRVLAPTSFPLESIMLYGEYIVQQLQFPIVQESKKLILSLELDYQEEKYGDLSDLTHSRIHFYRHHWNTRNVVRLLVSWRDTQKPIGTHFSFERPTVGGMRRLLRNIGDRFPESRLRKIGNKSRPFLPDQVLIPLNDYSEIKVFCKVTTKKKLKSLHLKVQPIRRS
ncbi:hypothetical protein GCK72_003850 [Caenorhabditis remanei]|uniref:F-box domain-containing protein n=1 Tax=Caenorhabditis remanei TaxID=31234 RepID=A0A6A5HAP5_CAERE|nr:hypothetical protein GCK72_003850 [Caenorhabditis remanei]KAF1763904.1 hypothetical protein GCK72_003850 [Caenorhabditis remanei]